MKAPDDFPPELRAIDERLLALAADEQFRVGAAITPGRARVAGMYHSLDAWRGVACLSVLVFHVCGYRWTGPDMGWAGVPMFFVISGYCIAGSTDRHVRQGLGWRAFMARRVRRIFPPYLAFLALALLLATVAARVPALEQALFPAQHGLEAIPRPETLSAGAWVGTLTLTEGWRPLLAGTDGARWYMSHAWSLGYEEQFYAVMGLLLALAGRSWTMGAVGITVVTTALMLQLPTRGLFVDGHWLSFAAGLAVYAHVQGYTRAWVMPALLGAYGGLLALLGIRLFLAAPCALMLIALHRFDSQVASSRWTAPLTWCGVRCYSIYLLHWPLTRLVDGLLIQRMGPTPAEGVLAVAIAGAITLSAAAVFFRYVEAPCLSRRPAAPARVEVAVG